jgi:hypothetical protein
MSRTREGGFWWRLMFVLGCSRAMLTAPPYVVVNGGSRACLKVPDRLRSFTRREDGGQKAKTIEQPLASDKCNASIKRNDGQTLAVVLVRQPLRTACPT